LDDTVTCLVRGPASRYPSGYLWLYPAWFIILCAAVVLVGEGVTNRRLPLWFGVTEVGGLFVAACTAVGVLRTARRVAFWADARGILLGPRTAGPRRSVRQVYLPWAEISQIRLVQRRYGVLVDIVLSAESRPVYRPGARRQAGRLLGTLVMPAVAGRGRTALTMPRLKPPGYRVRICEMSAQDLRVALQHVMPYEIPVRVLASLAALRLVTWSGRRAWQARSSWAVRQVPPPEPSRPPAPAEHP